MTETIRPVNALQHVFKKLDLELRPGAPLHSYRISDAQYSHLQHFILDAVQYRRLDSCAAVFALWAAERFRREYAGGGYTWDFLTEPLRLGKNYTDLHHLTRRGLREFGRTIRQSDEGTTFYLMTLAAEGGFPEALLAAPDGQARRAVRGILTEIEKVGSAAPVEVLDQVVADRVRVLSKGFQTREYRDLLRAFCLDIMALRARIPETIPVEARRDWLDANEPGWQAALPLRIESAAAQSLLSDVVRAESGSGTESLADRVLVRIGDAWIPKVRIAKAAEVPEWQLQVDDARLRSIRILPDTDLADYAPGLVLSADRSPETKLWEVQRDSAERRAEFTMSLGRPVTFRLMAEGVQVGSHTPPGGEAIDPDDLPTLWAGDEAEVDGAPQTLRRLGSGAIRTRALHVWVLPGNEGAKFDGLDVATDSAVNGSPLYRVTGQGRIFGSGWSMKIATASDEEASDRLIAYGPMVPGLRDAQRMGFHQGVPQFHGHGADGMIRALSPKDLRWRATGQTGWKNGVPPEDACLGLIQFCWRDAEGAARAFTSCRVMPKAARLALSEAGPGKIDFRVTGMPKGSTVSLGEGLAARVSENGSAALRMVETLATMGRVAVHLRPPESGGRPFDASLQRPGDQGWFADGQDKLLQRDIELDLGMLSGWRVLAPTDREVHLQIRLFGDHTPEHPVVLRVSNETALGALLPRFRGLMAICGPDSRLHLRVLVGPTPSPRITLRRHLREGDWQGDAFVLKTHSGTETAENLPARIVNLSAPGLVQTLEPLPIGQAFFDQLPEHPGPWMVFARDDRGLVRPPRPRIKQVEEALPAARFSDAFLACSNARTRDGRLGAFGRELVDLLSPMRQGDLGLFEQQLEDLGGDETLCSLDSFVALDRAPALAVLLLLRATKEQLSARIDLESISPFSWTTLPLDSWRQAIEARLQQLETVMVSAGLPLETAQTYAHEAVATSLRAIRDRRPELIGQLVLAGLETSMFQALLKVLTFPKALNNPEAELMSAAGTAVRQQDGTRHPFPLRSSYAPEGFARYDDAMRDLLNAPLVAADHVLGLQPHPPQPAIAIALLHYRLQHPDYFEAAMPAAIAFLKTKTA